MIGIASLLVAGASEIRLAVIGDVPCTQSITAQVVVLDCAATSIVDPHSPVVVIIDPVSAQRGVAAFPDLHPGKGVSKDVVILQHPLPAIVDEDAVLLAIVDAVAAQARVSAIVDGNTGQTLTGDIAVLQFQSPLSDIYTVPILTAHLP